jgi:hypothetical protein
MAEVSIPCRAYSSIRADDRSFRRRHILWISYNLRSHSFQPSEDTQPRQVQEQEGQQGQDSRNHGSYSVSLYCRLQETRRCGRTRTGSDLGLQPGRL